MRKFVWLHLILLVSCSKDVGHQQRSGIVESNVPELLRDLAREYAINKLDGISEAARDTLYFAYVNYEEVPDSAVYRKNKVDKIAIEAFQYTFNPVKDKPATWQRLWFSFDIRFIQGAMDSLIRFQYPLKSFQF